MWYYVSKLSYHPLPSTFVLSDLLLWQRAEGCNPKGLNISICNAETERH